MAKPRGIQWLEEQAGQTLDFQPTQSPTQDRHLSVRLTGDLAAALDGLASERGVTPGGLTSYRCAPGLHSGAGSARGRRYGPGAPPPTNPVEIS